MPNNKRVPLTLMTVGLESFWQIVQRTDMPISQVLLFLHVAQRGPLAAEDLRKATGVTQSSVSRNIAKLGKGILKDGKREPGLGLVENYPDPSDNRRDLVQLTTHGDEVATEMSRVINRLAKKLVIE
jgi:DNA-binding MarR family transcriptional regulator